MKFLKKQSDSEAFEQELRELFIGLPLAILKDNEQQWSFRIGSEFVVTTLGWRLIGARRIIVTDEDDGHQFGLPEPMDAQAEANAALANAVITGLDLDLRTGDLGIEIGEALKLQILTTSSGYEMWQVYRNGQFFGAGGNEGLR